MASDNLFYFLFHSNPDICAMGGITLEDHSQSRAYQEIFGLGESREAAKVALRGAQGTTGIEAGFDNGQAGTDRDWVGLRSQPAGTGGCRVSWGRCPPTAF